MAKVNFSNQAESFMSATFLNFMLRQIRKPENEGTLFKE